MPRPRPTLRPRSHSWVHELADEPISEEASSSSYSYYEHEAAAPPSSSLLHSLDLSDPWPTMLRLFREHLLGRIEEAERDLKVLQAYVEETEAETEDDDEDWPARRATVRRRRAPAGGDTSEDESAESTDEENTASTSSSGSTATSDDSMSDSALRSYVETAAEYLDKLRTDLRQLSVLARLPSESLGHFKLSQDAKASLDRVVQRHPLPSWRGVTLESLRTRLGESRQSLKGRARESAAALASRLAREMSALHEAASKSTAASLAQLPDFGSATDLHSKLPNLPSFPAMPPIPPLKALREHFVAESERLSSRLPSFNPQSLRSLRDETTGALAAGIKHLKDEATELLDEASQVYRAALEGGRVRLLRYEELPREWQSNPWILDSYRFIESDRWPALLRSIFEWHNETINVNSHLLGSAFVIYLALVVLPDSHHYNLSEHIADAAVAWLFIGAAFKCLMCSATWHLLSGCASHSWYRGAACVDFVGISALIAASVMGIEYYGFYCRPGLAALYMGYSCLLGVVGMILPWKPWFNENEHKMTRIAFFLSLAASALMPLAHMAFLYGITQTFWFYTPVIPSVAAYLTGLFFYANNVPERLAPGRWDTILSSHQLWHIAIVLAIYLHWRAMGGWLVEGSQGFSCANVSGVATPSWHLF